MANKKTKLNNSNSNSSIIKQLSTGLRAVETIE